MKKDKTKEQLIIELAKLRARVYELETKKQKILIKSQQNQNQPQGGKK